MEAATPNLAAMCWVLISAALVIFMTPGLAIFYGGMVGADQVLGMLMQNFVCMGIVTFTWILWGFSLAFGGGGNWWFIGNFDYVMLAGVPWLQNVPGFDGTITPLAFACFQMGFAIITPALVTGATAGRLKFSAFCLFVIVWSLSVYPIVARWIFSPYGWLNAWGALDFAGGLVVHINAGSAALALLAILGNRTGFPDVPSPPHHIPLVILGAGILWFGWFGFNAGSALTSSQLAAQAFLNTHVAAAGGMVGWLAVGFALDKTASSVGTASGAVSGLVAITPCAGFINGWASWVLGVLAGVLCFFAVGLKVATRFKIDDTADVIGVHLVGGIFGSVMLGFFANTQVNSAGANGVFFGGGGALLGKQCTGIIAVMVFSFVCSWVIAKLIDLAIGLRVTPAEEEDYDQVLHGERAYYKNPERLETPFIYTKWRRNRRSQYRRCSTVDAREYGVAHPWAIQPLGILSSRSSSFRCGAPSAEIEEGTEQTEQTVETANSVASSAASVQASVSPPVPSMPSMDDNL